PSSTRASRGPTSRTPGRAATTTKAAPSLLPDDPVDPRFADGDQTLLPVSWADDRFTPPAGTFCGCCRGQSFWSDSRGWCCTNCHPPPPGAPARFVSTHQGT